jgi:hypothetical protein
LISDSKVVFKYKRERLSESEIYKALISRLFKPILHRNTQNNIVFASRGKTFNNDSLTDALEQAKRNCFYSWGIQHDNLVSINHCQPSESIGLQIIDYYLWVISRLFEQEDDSYFQVVNDKYSLIWDIDDTREKGYGVYYHKRNQISLSKIKKL